ncbi:F-box/kelch-repeat protein [Pyrus ussuriensis x Pyrus communis]|uniref:F-box/kelch-repeat protein n=1 Tax=Pyrus ussuriensis x Pyrus communis TaxID=2448454 RepID=A0A5N5HDG4_9ROSA|nr:F-box/kelch-repeat protein [Pyrus ussuriensis x Pyrus communis]
MTEISSLSSDVTELILSYLPIPTLIRASAVCKHWHSLISSSIFSSLHSHKYPWFFLYGIHNTSSNFNQSFAFDPFSNLWFRLPSPTFPSQSSSFFGADGFFLITAPLFTFSPILKRHWLSTSPLRFSPINPLVGVDSPPSSSSPIPSLVVVGGVRFIGNLVDIEDCLDVEIYNPDSDSWLLCPLLPADFRSGNSSQSLSSALFKRRFYVFRIYSCFVALDPPPAGVVFSFLISSTNHLILTGICNGLLGPSFNLWKVEETTMEFSEIAIMPQDLLYGLFDDDEEDKFASLKCVGLGNLIYVFNEEYHKKYPACVCEIVSDDNGGPSGKCSWRRMPQLPSPVNKFHKVVSFSSTVSLRNILRGEWEGEGDGVGDLQPMLE